MVYKKGSIDYQANLEAMYQLENVVPMTLQERDALRRWVRNGHDIDSNPWHYFESDRSQMTFLKARRILFGASHGPWDSWEFETPWLLDHEKNTLFQQ